MCNNIGEDRIVIVNINTELNNNVIIQRYKPTTKEDDKEIKRSHLREGTRADDKLITMGDRKTTGREE